jgi:hypothetical protein
MFEQQSLYGGLTVPVIFCVDIVAEFEIIKGIWLYSI